VRIIDKLRYLREKFFDAEAMDRARQELKAAKFGVTRMLEVEAAHAESERAVSFEKPKGLKTGYLKLAILEDPDFADIQAEEDEKNLTLYWE